MAETREGKFTLDIKRWCEKAQGNADKVVRATAMECLGRIVMRTPVGNPDNWKVKRAPPGYVGGRLRGSWVVSVDAPSTRAPARIDPSGAATIAEGTGILSEAVAGPPIYIMSNLPYAIPIEYGHSQTQAPAGMVRVTIVDFQGIVRDATKALP